MPITGPSNGDEALDNTTDVETPECVRFRHHTAGPFRRGLAYLIDLVLRGAIALGFGMLVTASSGGPRSVAWSSGLMLVVLFGLEWGYYVALEAFMNGQTPGKRALGLRVVKQGGYPVGFVDCMLRNLLRAADFLPLGYVLGLMTMAGDRRFRRLGDMAAGTMVIIEQRPRALPALQLDPPPTEAELGGLPGRALRPDELDAIEMFLRRPALSPARRRELAEMIAPFYGRRLNVVFDDPVRFLGLLYLRSAPAPDRKRVRAAVGRPG